MPFREGLIPQALCLRLKYKNLKIGGFFPSRGWCGKTSVFLFYPIFRGKKKNKTVHVQVFITARKNRLFVF